MIKLIRAWWPSHLICSFLILLVTENTFASGANDVIYLICSRLASMLLVAFHTFNSCPDGFAMQNESGSTRQKGRLFRHRLLLPMSFSARMFNLVRNRPTHSTQPLSCECDKQCEEEAQPSTHGQQQNSSTIVKEQRRRRRKELAS